MPNNPRKGRKIGSSLDDQAKQNNHKRVQKIMDAGTFVLEKIIIIVPVLIGLLGSVYIIHVIFAKEWDLFANILRQAITHCITALMTYLIAIGLIKKND